MKAVLVFFVFIFGTLFLGGCRQEPLPTDTDPPEISELPATPEQVQQWEKELKSAPEIWQEWIKTKKDFSLEGSLDKDTKLVNEPKNFALTAPKMRSAKVQGKNTIEVTWDAAEGATDYELSWQESTKRYSGDFQTVKTGGRTSYVVKDLTEGTKYCFFVTALDRSGKKSVKSANLNATTPEPEIPAPAVPKIRSAEVRGQNIVEVTWESSENATDYEFSWREYGRGSFQTVKTNGKTSYVVKNLTEGTTYQFIVTALNRNDKKSVRSATAEATTPKQEILVPAVPKIQTVNATGQNAVNVVWESSENATDYELSWKPDKGNFQTVKTNGKTNYTVEGLTEGTTYHFVVTALNRNGKKSGESDVMTAMTQKTESQIENLDMFIKVNQWTGYSVNSWALQSILAYGTKKLQDDLINAESTLKNASPFDDKSKIQADLEAVNAEIKKERQKIASKKFYCDYIPFWIDNITVSGTETTADITFGNKHSHDDTLPWRSVWRKIDGGDGLWRFCFPSFNYTVRRDRYNNIVGRITGNTEEMKEFCENPRNYKLRIYLTGLIYDAGVGYNFNYSRGKIVRFEIREKDQDNPKPLGDDPFANQTKQRPSHVIQNIEKESKYSEGVPVRVRRRGLP